MLFFNHSFNNLNELFVEQLKDIYDCENRLIDALPKMSDAATSTDLKEAFNTHLLETRTHISRLEELFRSMGLEPKRVTCQGIKGLLAEGDEMIGAKGCEMTHDAALIAAAQKVEHYEMASYGTLAAWAEQLGMSNARDLLRSTLEEEEKADVKLTMIAETHINALAQH
jgi:ferritin-like metal-binding protein YciE